MNSEQKEIETTLSQESKNTADVVRKVSIWGLITGIVMIIIGVKSLFIVTSVPTPIPTPALPFMAAGIAIIIRSFNPPIGIIKPIVIFLGTFLIANIILMTIYIPAYRNDPPAIFASLLLMGIGILLLRIGFRRPREKDTENEAKSEEKEREILSDSADRYKNLSEQFPQYNEYFALTAAMGKMDRENIENRFIKYTSGKLMRMYDKGPASIAEGAYGILIAELIRKEFDMSKL